MSIAFSVTRSAPRDAKAIGIGVFTEGAVGRALGIDRAGLSALGFEGKPGQACVVAGGTGPTRVALGLGKKGDTTLADVRRAAGAFVRAAGRLGSLATGIVETAGVDAKGGAQAVVEGATLGSYSFGRFKSEAPKSGVESFAVIAPEATAKATQAGVDRGVAIGQAVAMARDLVNTPGGSLNARDMADLASKIAAEHGLGRRGHGRGRHGARGPRRHARREPGLDRAAAAHQAHLHASQPGRLGRPGRQGDHVRLGWPLAEVGRRDDVDEDRHVGRGGGAGDDERAQGDRSRG